MTNGVTRVTFTRNSVQADWRIRKGRERTERSLTEVRPAWQRKSKEVILAKIKKNLRKKQIS